MKNYHRKEKNSRITNSGLIYLTWNNPFVVVVVLQLQQQQSIYLIQTCFNKLDKSFCQMYSIIITYPGINITSSHKILGLKEVLPT